MKSIRKDFLWILLVVELSFLICFICLRTLSRPLPTHAEEPAPFSMYDSNDNAKVNSAAEETDVKN
jgi:hypothetical protein